MCTFDRFMVLPPEVRGIVAAHLHFADQNALSLVSRSLRNEFGQVADDTFNQVVRRRADAMLEGLVQEYRLADNAETSAFREVLAKYCRTYWEIVCKGGSAAVELNELKPLISYAVAEWFLKSGGVVQSPLAFLRINIVWFIENRLTAQLQAQFPLRDANNNNSGNCPGGCVG
jgi:hypothetical protein